MFEQAVHQQDGGDRSGPGKAKGAGGERGEGVGNGGKASVFRELWCLGVVLGEDSVGLVAAGAEGRGDGGEVVDRARGRATRFVGCRLEQQDARGRGHTPRYRRAVRGYWTLRASSADGRYAGVREKNDDSVVRERAAAFETGRGLCFVLGAFRGGTTLLRKVLDSHPAVHAPAETWFLLGLRNLWVGKGGWSGYEPSQLSHALKTAVDEPAFVACCRAFAGRYYAETMAAGASVYVDKTPFYLNIWAWIAGVFPEARFVVISRDPRGILWSRHTWAHADAKSIGERVKGVGRDIRKIAAARQSLGRRAHWVRYEDLCASPAAVTPGLCGFLGVDAAAAGEMVEYGSKPHGAGYGDEKSAAHDRPHTGSVSRWGTGSGEIDGAMEAALVEACGAEALRDLGYAFGEVGSAA